MNHEPNNLSSRDESIAQAARVLRECDALLVTAGAGMGVDSGLPDFRGNQGFWKAYPPIARLGLSFYEMASPEWFVRDPRLAWAFYGHRINLYRKTIPHKGFLQLLEIGKSKKGGYFVFTSNVDGQFQKAGYDENRIEECHGSVHFFQCIRPCGDDIRDAGMIEVQVDEDVFKALDPLPECEKCGSLARPNVLMFGDWSWNENRTDEQHRRLSEWLRIIQDKGLKIAIVEVGAGTAISTVRNTSENLAARYNGTLIRINPRDYMVRNERYLSIPLGGAEGINRIFELI
ncbi:MAG: Sir2 family NAD-dependent protein deacetylase [Thermodesulfobacteriota bacterium]|nr:Sir2 family NAD-dependent protein deacetylase [Thermodesulfobacteriota bacterium]